MLLYMDSCGDFMSNSIEEDNRQNPYPFSLNNTFSLEPGRNSGKAWYGTGNSRVEITLPKRFQNEVMIMGFNYKHNGLAGSEGFNFSNENRSFNTDVVLKMVTPNVLMLKGNKGVTNHTLNVSGVCSSGSWHHIEVKINFTKHTSGSMELRIDGVSIGSATGSIIGSTGSDVGITQCSIWLGSEYVDDIYICDASGSVNNNFLGPCKVLALRSESNQLNQWTVVGTSNLTGAVSGNYKGDLSYLYSSTSSASAMFSMENLPENITQVKGAQLLVSCKKSAPGYRAITPYLRHSGTDYATTEIGLWEDVYKYDWQCFSQNPVTSNSWEVSDINNLILGTKLTG